MNLIDRHVLNATLDPPTVPYSLRREFGVSHWCCTQWDMLSVCHAKNWWLSTVVCPDQWNVACLKSDLTCAELTCNVFLIFVWHWLRRSKSNTMFRGPGRYIVHFWKRATFSCCCSWWLLDYLSNHRILCSWYFFESNQLGGFPQSHVQYH